MARALHIGLLLITLLGLVGQSTAMAMTPVPVTIGSMQASMAEMDCMDVAIPGVPGDSPCKKMTFQCMVLMGCTPATFVQPDAPSLSSSVGDREKSVPTPAPRLSGRTYGPEPDPPSSLI